QSLDTSKARCWRQGHPVCEIDVRDPSVLLQAIDDADIDLIERVRHGTREYWQKTLLYGEAEKISSKKTLFDGLKWAFFSIAHWLDYLSFGQWTFDGRGGDQAKFLGRLL